MSEDTMNPRAALYKKILVMRDLVNKQDWANDKSVSLPGRGSGPSGYGYLSIDKIKKNMAPLYVEAGLDFKPDYSNAVNDTSQGRNHWKVDAAMYLIDVDTGEEDVTHVFGESMDSQDKGLLKAQTYALKAFYTSKFNLADGVDPDKVYGADDGYKVRSPEEIAEMRQKVLEKGVRKDAAAPKTVSAPKKEVPAPKKEAPAPEPEPEVKEEAEQPVKEPAPKKETPKKEAPKKAEKKEVPAPKKEAPAPKKDGELFKPSGPLNNTIDNIVNRLSEKAKAGQIEPEVYNEMSMARATMASDADAKDFIRKYRSLTK